MGILLENGGPILGGWVRKGGGILPSILPDLEKCELSQSKSTGEVKESKSAYGFFALFRMSSLDAPPPPAPANDCDKREEYTSYGSTGNSRDRHIG